MSVSVRGVVVLALLFGLVLSACAAPQKPTAAPERPTAASPAPAAPQVQLTGEQQLIEGAKKEGIVVWWSVGFGSPTDTDTVLRPFYERYPFLKVNMWDSTGTEMMVKLTEEAKAGRQSADVIYFSEKHLLATSQWKELVAEYQWPNTENWLFLRGHNYYRVIAGTPIGTTYNTSLITAAEAPRSWEDLKNTKWRGKAVMTRSMSDVPLYFAYLWGEKGKLNWDKSFSFWREVVSSAQPKMMTGVTAPLQMHAAGESALFIMTALYNAMRFKARGAPLEIASAPSAFTNALALALVKNAPHPNAAKLLANYLTSYESQIILGDAILLAVAHPEASKKARLNLEIASRGIKIDEVPLEFNTPENNSKSVTFWLELLR